MPRNNQELIYKYGVWLFDIQQEKKRHIDRLVHLEVEEMKIKTWVKELKGEESIENRTEIS